MSITIVTGVPGSGKTLYTVANLIRPMVGAKTTATNAQGDKVEIQRKIFTNINGLLLDHDLIDASEEHGLRGWHKWAQPGDFIVYDEFQKAWPPRPNGSKVPEDIQALDTHRHRGVDFVLVTQHLMNIDRHILGLCDRHLHMRRVSNLPFVTVYEWDHASRSLLFKNAISKTPWRYPKSVFQLYKSAEIHTKQRRKMPAAVWFILAGLVGSAWAVPNLVGRISERNEAPAIAAAAPSAKPGQPAQALELDQVVDQVQPGQPLPGQPGQETFSGCVATATDCKCYTQAGAKVDVQFEFCAALQAGRKPLEAHLLPESNLPTLAQADALQSLKESRGPLRAE